MCSSAGYSFVNLWTYKLIVYLTWENTARIVLDFVSAENCTDEKDLCAGSPPGKTRINTLCHFLPCIDFMSRHTFLCGLLHLTFAAHKGNITGPFAPSDWENANTMCQNQSQGLLTVDSEEEETGLKQIIPANKEWVIGEAPHSTLCFLPFFQNTTQSGATPRKTLLELLLPAEFGLGWLMWMWSQFSEDKMATLPHGQIQTQSSEANKLKIVFPGLWLMTDGQMRDVMPALNFTVRRNHWAQVRVLLLLKDTIAFCLEKPTGA